MKALVCYCTKKGTTQSVAHRIAMRLGAELLDLSDRGAKRTDLSGYDTVIVGAPVYMGRWAGKAVRFTRLRTGELAEKRFGYFVVSLDAKAGVEPARSVLPPELASTESAWMGGAFVWNRLGVFHRLVAKAANGGKEGDYSIVDSEAIDDFSDRMGRAL